MAPTPTRERILDAAEELFSKSGIQGTTLRALTRRADVNLAAVHYHFGSKDGLLDAVVERQAEALNAARARDLGAMIAEADGARLDPGAILTAYFRPVIEHMEELQGHGRQATMVRLLARIEAEGPDVMSALLRRHFGDISARYLDALVEALPELPAQQTAERFRFAAAVITQLIAGNLQLDVIPGHPPSEEGVAARARHALSFIAAGLCSAPVCSGPSAEVASDVLPVALPASASPAHRKAAP